MKRRAALLFALSLLIPVCANARTLPGIDNLLLHYRNLLENKRVAIVTNQTGCTAEGESDIDALRWIHGATVAAVFTPEHGLNGKARAGTPVYSYFDSSLDVRVYSLYGRQRKPTPEMLEGIDAVVYDIQDIGVRSYTFISTLGLVMQAAAEHGTPVIVLDRPCPLGDCVDGNVLDTALRSFVGMYPIPYVYGMTPGELAWMLNDEGMNGAPCKLTIVPMLGWRRAMTWEQTGLRWIPPSPNIPFPSTAAYYAAFGIVGEIGTGAYQGINTEDAFRVFAAPQFDRKTFEQRFVRLHHRGIRCIPYDTMLAGEKTPERLEGVRFVIRNDASADLFLTGLQTIAVLRSMGVVPPLDSARNTILGKLCGGSAVQDVLNGIPAETVAGKWLAGRERFLRIRKKYLLYK